MNSLFLYGTLRHLPLLEVVLGREPETSQLTDATLENATTTWVEDAPFPMIQLGTEGQANGLLLSDLSDQDVARLDFYEGGFGYALRRADFSWACESLCSGT